MAYPNGYTFRRTLVLSSITLARRDQADFPVLFSQTLAYLRSSANGGDVQSANGYDIIFTSDEDGLVPLKYDREVYAATTGQLIAWIKFPALSSIVYMFYRNASVVTDQSDPENVWTDYEAVWHLPNGSVLTALDATANNNDGTITNATAAAAEVYGGANFPNSVASRINAGTGASLDDLVNPGPSSFSFWVKLDSFNNAATLLTKNDGYINGEGWVIWPGTGASAGVQFEIVRAAINDSFWVVPLSTGAFVHVLVVYIGSLFTDAVRIYINGSLAVSTYFVGGGSVSSDAGDALQIGGDSGFLGATARLNGTMDEVRISREIRDNFWGYAEYQNQSSPTGFLSIGAEDADPPSAPTFIPQAPAVIDPDAVITRAPLPIYPPTLPRGSANTDVGGWPSGEGAITVGMFFGPIIYGGFVYHVLLPDQARASGGTSGQITGHIAVYKSEAIDPWAQDANFAHYPQDVANQPDNEPASNPPVVVGYREGSGKIDIVYQEDPAPFNLLYKEFDCSTDTYGAAEILASTFNAKIAESYYLLRLSNDDIVLFWDNVLSAAPGTEGIYYQKRTSAVWGAPVRAVTTTSGAAAYLMSAVVDPSDVIHMLFQEDTSLSANLRYFQMNSSNVVSGLTTIRTTGLGTINRGGNAVIWNDQLAFPVITRTPGLDFYNIELLLGAPLSSPTWTFEEPDADDISIAGLTPSEITNSAVQWPSTALDKDGNLVVFWTVLVLDPSFPATANKMWMNTRTEEGWGTPGVFYDTIANPPDDPDAGNLIHTVSIAQQQPNGSWFADVSLETDGTCAGFLLISPGDTAHLTLIKAVMGGTAVAADWTVSADGPTPITGAGQASGEVDPGDYILSESGGLPGYTNSGWICVGGTQDGDNLTIAAGDTVVCTLTNVYVSPPEPPPPPELCIINPITTPTPSLVSYTEPLELQGS